jgi:hypothetical protein
VAWLICCWIFCTSVDGFWVFVGVDYVNLGVFVGCGDVDGWPGSFIVGFFV